MFHSSTSTAQFRAILCLGTLVAHLAACGPPQSSDLDPAASAFKKAQVYESINNFSGARAQCEQVFAHHPDPGQEYHQKCRALLELMEEKAEAYGGEPSTF